MHTLDIRRDIAVDFPGIDIGKDPLPFENSIVNRILAYHVLEHAPRESWGHVFQEIWQIMISGGTCPIETPHAGTWSAMTDPTHQGPGGTTPAIANYLDGSRGSYWPELS
jgi:predicted SAM-dependent methyltransferase